jgi:hypothetical protein
MMWPFFISVAFVIGIVVASWLWKREVGGPSEEVDASKLRAFPFERTQSVLNEFEHGMYRMLERELRKDFYVFTKVRLGDLVQLKRKSSREAFYNRLVSGRHVDFLLCDRDTVKPILVIQLVEKKNADEHDITEDVLNSAHIPYMFLSPKKAIAPSELTYLIRETIKKQRQQQQDARTELL